MAAYSLAPARVAPLQDGDQVRGRRALKVAACDPEIDPQVGQVADDRAVELAKPGEVERGDGGDAAQRRCSRTSTTGASASASR